MALNLFSTPSLRKQPHKELRCNIDGWPATRSTQLCRPQLCRRSRARPPRLPSPARTAAPRLCGGRRAVDREWAGLGIARWRFDPQTL